MDIKRDECCSIAHGARPIVSARRRAGVGGVHAGAGGAEDVALLADAAAGGLELGLAAEGAYHDRARAAPVAGVLDAHRELVVLVVEVARRGVVRADGDVGVARELLGLAGLGPSVA